MLNPSRLIRQILANFVEVEFQTTASHCQEKKKKVVVLCSRPQQNVKLD